MIKNQREMISILDCVKKIIIKIFNAIKSVVIPDKIKITDELFFRVINIKDGILNIYSIATAEIVFSKSISIQSGLEFLDIVEESFLNIDIEYYYEICDISRYSKLYCRFKFYNGTYNYYKNKVAITIKNNLEIYNFYISENELRNAKSALNKKINTVQ